MTIHHDKFSSPYARHRATCKPLQIALETKRTERSINNFSQEMPNFIVIFISISINKRLPLLCNALRLPFTTHQLSAWRWRKHFCQPVRHVEVTYAF